MTRNEIIKHPGDSIELILSNRGATGFSIQWEVNDETVATVERLENIAGPNLRAGDQLKTKYAIHLKKKGTVTVHFYEARIWEENAPKKTLELLKITVE